MLDIIKNLIALVQQMDPKQDVNAINLNLAYEFDKNHPELQRWHLISANQRDENEVIDIQIKPLNEIASLNPCSQLHVQHLSINHIIDAMTDVDLGQALSDFLAVQALQPRENDSEDVMQGIETTKELGELVGQFLRYEEDLFDEFNQLSHQFHPVETKYAPKIREEIKRVINDFEYLRQTTIASEKAINILKQEAAKRYGIDINNSLINVVVNQVILNAKKAEHSSGQPPEENMRTEKANENLPITEETDYTIPVSIIAALSGIDQLYATTVMELPRWAADLCKIVAPNVLASKFYPTDVASIAILETAKGIWSKVDGEALAQFDAAYNAATELVN